MEVLTVIIGIATILGTVFAGLQWLHSRKKISIHPLSTSQKKEECQIRLAPALHDIPAVMNGGRFEGNFANFQIRFGSETDLELVDAILLHKATTVRCESRNTKLEGGKQWNSLLFESSQLPLIPGEILLLKIIVCDHSGHCCELDHELQMKQFPHPEYTGRNSGRWEIHTNGIFRIQCAERKKFQ